MDKAGDDMEFDDISSPKRTGCVARIPVALLFRRATRCCLCWVYSTRKNAKNIAPVLEVSRDGSAAILAGLNWLRH